MEIARNISFGSAIFIHSGFRSSSTWFWSKFREQENLLCYYEPLNEQLENLTEDLLDEARPEAWRSRHPQGAPYVLEYAQILAGDGGVVGFPKVRSLGERYIGLDGPEGGLDRDVLDYVRGLIEHAQERQKMPVLAFTRSLGRVAGMHAAFGGFHILLTRNLFHQWNSYAGQARFGNWYFIHSMFETLELASRDPIISFMASIFPPDTMADFNAWVDPQNLDNVFCYFIGFHLYFETLARRHVDLTVNINVLAQNRNYRTRISSKIGEVTNTKIDFEDAKIMVDLPISPIINTASCKAKISRIIKKIQSDITKNKDERMFISNRLRGVWREHAFFSLYNESSFEYISKLNSEINIVQHDLEVVRQEASELRKRLEEISSTSPSPQP